MSQSIEERYSHLKLRIIDSTYKYVLFNSQKSFLDGIIKASESTVFPYSIFSTQEERSAILPSHVEVDSIKEKDVGEWSCFCVVGEMPFGSAEGLIATISATLKKNRVGICAVSSYKTDLFFVRNYNMETAQKALRTSGWDFI